MNMEEIKQRVLNLQNLAKEDLSSISQAFNDESISLLIEAELHYSNEHIERAGQQEGETYLANILRAESHAKRAIRDALTTWAVYNYKQIESFGVDFKNILQKSSSYSEANELKNEIQNLMSKSDDIDLDLLRKKLHKQNELLNSLQYERPFLNKLILAARKDKISFLIAIVSAIIGILSLVVSINQAIDIFSNLFGNVMIISNAYASTEALAPESSVDIKGLFNLLFTFGVLIAFFWSFIVSIHNNSSSKRQAAKSYANLFGGILIGSAKSTLGL